MTTVSREDYLRYREIQKTLPSLIRQCGEAFIGGDRTSAAQIGMEIHNLRAEKNVLEAAQLKAAFEQFVASNR